MKLSRNTIIILVIIAILLALFFSRKPTHFFGVNHPSPSPTTLIPLTATPYPTNSPGPNTNWYVNPESSDSSSGNSEDTAFKTIQHAVNIANPGDTINLSEGTYNQDVVSKKNGTATKPIIITGPSNAIVKGSGKGRIVEIHHDYITLRGFTVDGLHGDPNSIDSYTDKLIYVQGSENHDGVTGLRILNMTIKNAGGECVRLRYFVTQSEVAHNTITSCGNHDFKFKDGGKNGEGLYIGTAPEQRTDGKNPTADTDESNTNLIHDNTFNTQGNECVDIKEDSKYNIVEHNSCTGQLDSESGGMDSRGGYNIFRYNEIFENVGAGIRLGGDTVDQNINNDIYENIIHDNKNGGIKFQTKQQGKICGNTMTHNTRGNSVGEYGEEFDPIASCEN